jgi:hypothetical protein
MDAMQKRLNDAVNVMLEKVEREKMRPLSKESYLGMAACYDRKNASPQEIQHCVQGCGRKMEAVNQIIQGEMTTLQSRLERCLAGCQDEVKDKMHGKDNSQANMELSEKLAMQCAKPCVEKHINMLKSVKYKIETDIDKVAKM